MINDTKFIRTTFNGNSAVRYFLYKDDNTYKKNRINFPSEAIGTRINKLNLNVQKEKGFITNTNLACFANLPIELGLRGNSPILKGCNRIIYYPNFYTSDKFDITKDHIKKWYTLCKKHGLLPEYFNIKDAVENEAVVFDTSAHSLNMLYIYLCMVRFLAAEPTYVLNVLRMCCTYRINFVVALVFFAYTNICNMNHHFISVNSCYMKPKNIFDMKDIDLGIAVGIYKIIDNKGALDKEGSTYNDAKEFFTANMTISCIKFHGFKIPANKLRSSFIPKMLKLSNDELKKRPEIKKLKEYI